MFVWTHPVSGCAIRVSGAAHNLACFLLPYDATELEQRITMIRQNINELMEQAAAYSGAEDENRTADRITQQEQELSRLIELRDALLAR
jgi:hypothetical protein